MLAFSMRKFFWGLALVALGLLIWAHNFGLVALSFKFSRDWPVLIVALGLLSVWKALFGSHWWEHRFRVKPSNNIKDILDELEGGKISAEEAARRMGK